MNEVNESRDRNSLPTPVDLDSILPFVSRPNRYTGNEFNRTAKDWSKVSLRWALLFPDLYEIGMSHQGVQILYHLINSRPDMLAERAYAPARDLEDLLRSQGRKLFSLESHIPLSEFDLLGITLPYELCYTNILTILSLAGLPFRSRDRIEGQPLVIGGGPCGFHPEPVADFFDAILLGDGEEAVFEISEAVLAGKRKGLSREEVLELLAGINGVYVPSRYVPLYDAAGRFSGMSPSAETAPVRRRVLADLEGTPSFPPLVPHTRIVHDRLGVEIARGCTRGCRFCQAGIIYRPVRERSPEKILQLAEQGINASGFDEVALLSLSTGDYSCIADLLVRIMDRMSDRKVSVSMPSMRVGTLIPEMMEQIRRVRKTGFTLAPEAGTDRLRQVINKGITEQDLLEASRAAFGLGWKLLKFYFMFGLPTETDEDLSAIPQLVQKALSTSGGGGRKINVSVATFVPKPHTPFQRVRQLSVEEGFARIDTLKRILPRGRGFQLKWHDPRQSYVEGIMSRGDRKLSAVIEKAWQLGARLDAWTDHFHLETWLAAAAACGVDPDRYLQEIPPEAPLPWDHLDCGVDREFLEEELKKAVAGEYTPDCRVHGCQKCGLCDFKKVKPIVAKALALQPATQGEARKGAAVAAGGRFVYRIQYSRTGPARFFGHLELIQMFYRVLQRVKLPLNFSQGFNPSPKIAFSPALPLGTESFAEYLQIELAEPLLDEAMVLADLNRQLPEGFFATSLAPHSGKVEQRIVTCYHILPSRRISGDLIDSIKSREKIEIRVLRKGRERVVDAAPLLKGLTLLDDGRIELVMLTETSKATLKPMEIMEELFALDPAETTRAKVVKVSAIADD
ncbi:MAG: TIGR03960 family B12-binding radical SAM protein [Proteobacteria bacterium]|nr:TIGR03960 family B12-binding radical SAM protein [Pseudomonadota bacterium]MBU1737363.1 TIGR03960 family B12-binding radical SAM protein [Pseudomonadota bacterium]